MSKILVLGIDWIVQYLIGDILLKDQDGEEEITIIDSTSTIEDLFHFPPISKYAGDERINFHSDLEGKFSHEYDVIILNTNIIQEAKYVFESLNRLYYQGRIIIISSWEVYGWQGRRQIPFDEFDTKLEPYSPLGRTKYEIEEMARQYKDLNIVIFRLSTIFGPYMPEDSEILRWLNALLTQRPILVDQPAARALDLCYFYNVLAPIEKAFTADLPKHVIINLGSADSDYKGEKGKIKPQIFEKHVVEMLVGLRVLLDSQSKIEISNEGIAEHTGKGYHSQLKTHQARKLLEYFPIVDPLKGLLQTSFWLQKSMEIDEASLGRSIENIYPTLDDRKVLKVGEAFQDKEVEYESRKTREEQQRRARTEANQILACPMCNHAPTSIELECKCSCHSAYIEAEPEIQ